MNSNSDLMERGLGLFSLLAGIFLGYIGVYSPLQQAMHHAPDVHLSMRPVVLAPFAVCMGLMSLVMGQQFRVIVGERRRLSPLGWVITLLLAGLGFALYHWLEGQLRGYGYGV